MSRGLLLLTLLACLAAPAARAQSTEQEAGDTSGVDRDKGPLRERIAPVSGKLFSKAGRFELSPSINFSLGDPFFVKYIFGGAITYHLVDSLALSVRGGYAAVAVSGAAQICTLEATATQQVGCHAPRFDQLDGRAPGQLKVMGGADVQWAPIYGKLSLLAERFLHFDLYVVGGVAAVQYIGPTADGRSAPEFTLGGNAGGGMRFFVNRWIAVRVELRDLIYRENVQPVPQGNSLRNQLLFELGVSFFFPTTFGET